MEYREIRDLLTMSPQFDVFRTGADTAAGSANPGGKGTNPAARPGHAGAGAAVAAPDKPRTATASGISCRRLSRELYPPVALWAPSGAGERTDGAGGGTSSAGARANPAAGKGVGAAPGAGPTVLWGWGLLRQAEACGLRRVAVRPVVCEPREAVLLMLELERACRHEELSLHELAAVADICGFLGVEVDHEISRAASGDGAMAAKVERFQALPQLLRNELDAGRVDLRTVEQLAEYAADEAANAVARTGGLSFSRRRQLLRVAVETLRRERRQADDARGSGKVDPSVAGGSAAASPPDGGGSPVAGGSPSLLELIDEALSQPDPVAALSRRRYPSLTELSDRLERIRSETIEKSGVELSEPPYFEGERYSVSFTFAGSEELDRRIAALERLKSRTRELQDLL